MSLEVTDRTRGELAPPAAALPGAPPRKKKSYPIDKRFLAPILMALPKRTILNMDSKILGRLARGRDQIPNRSGRWVADQWHPEGSGGPPQAANRDDGGANQVKR